MNRLQKTGIFLFTCIFITPVFGQGSEIPVKPELDFVTTDTTTGFTTIVWKPSPSSDVEKYIIYYEVNTPSGPEGVRLDSVNALTFSYSYLYTGNTPRSYSVTAMDSARNESLRKPGLHSPVIANLYYDSCNFTMNISWSSYKGWGIGLSGYRIYRLTTTEPWLVLKGVGAGDTVYNEFNIVPNEIYTYFIEAVRNDGQTSTSAIKFKSTSEPIPPGLLRLEYASVTSDGEVEVSFTYDGQGEMDDFSLLRSSNKFSDFIEVGRSMNVPEPGGVFTDQIPTGFNSYYYKVGVLNSCGVNVLQSNLGVNILLNADTTGQVVELSWNAYENWEDGVESYKVYRQDPQGSFILIANLEPDTRRFIDDPDDFSNLGLSGEIMYKIVATRSDQMAESVSNLLRVKITSDIRFIPDAFTPNGDGRNDFFIPRFNFYPSSYLLIVLNRNGNEVFRTTDPEEGWDGRVNSGSLAAEGVYVYYLRYTSYNGVKKERKGHITVFYP